MMCFKGKLQKGKLAKGRLGEREWKEQGVPGRDASGNNGEVKTGGALGLRVQGGWQQERA